MAFLLDTIVMNIGDFLARISRVRTSRQFVVGTLTIPFGFILLWISIFGNSALDLVVGGNDDFGEGPVSTPERAIYSLPAEYPGALVMSNFISKIEDPHQDGPE